MLPASVARAGLRATAQQFAMPRTAAMNGLRTYATATQEVKPPVALYGVDGTYATALVGLSCFLPWTSVINGWIDGGGNQWWILELDVAERNGPSRFASPLTRQNITTNPSTSTT